MKLGFHYHVPADGHSGSICIPGFLGRFIDSLAQQVERLDLFLHGPRLDEKDLLDYQLHSSNVRLFSLGLHKSVPARLLYSYPITAPLREHREDLDALLIRGPSPLLPAVAHAVRGLPLALLLVGDYLTGTNDLPQPRWRKEAIRVFSWWNAQQQFIIAKNSLTFVNSHKLYQQLQHRIPHLIETRTTTLYESDFFIREDTCQNYPVHLLYTGRMDRAKGIMDIVQAVIELYREGEEVMLDLVGMIEKGDPILDEVKAKAAAAGIAERVRYHGYHAVGPDLFQFYRQADVYVLASRSSEGFPRTIWEAMAHCLPVVATRVGSIPDYISDVAQLVEPKDIPCLVNAIRTLLHDSALRKSRIIAGMQLARKVTLEAQVPFMVENIERWTEEQKCK